MQQYYRGGNWISVLPISAQFSTTGGRNWQYLLPVVLCWADIGFQYCQYPALGRDIGQYAALGWDIDSTDFPAYSDTVYSDTRAYSDTFGNSQTIQY